MLRTVLMIPALCFLVTFQAVTDADAASLSTKEQCSWVHTCFETVKSSDGKYGKVTLNYKGSAEPMTVVVRVRQNGMTGTYKKVQRHVLKEPQQIEILELQAPSGRSSFKWRWRFNQHPGSEPATHDDSVIYRLPYEDGESFEVIQTYGGRFSHNSDNYYAIDWYMPVGTPILAARGGTVAMTRADSDRKGKGWDNHVMIRHADGTYGWYLHLRKGGVTVSIGDTVKAGDLIGYSGNTGYSRRPHLHFQVSSVVDSPNKVYQSFPTKFMTTDGIVEKLRHDRWYEAAPLKGN